tara:strand:- start:75 stop:506 length:432 start_codon:yes stop_codon:yes gene_type:complete
MSFYRIFVLFIILPYIFGCVEKTTFSGKILTQDDLSNIKVSNKKELLELFGPPSYEDNIINKFFYFTEMSKNKNFYIKNVEYSYLFVFEFDKNDQIINKEAINLLNAKNHKYNKIETQNNIIKRGMLEKIFGGVGPNQLPNSQ